MGKLVLRDVNVFVNGTDLSNYASAVEIEDSRDDVELSGFGPNGYREFDAGLGDASLTITLFQDFGVVHGALLPLYSSGDTAEVIVQPTSGAISPTNPAFVMQGRLFSYSGMSGGPGEASTMDVVFRNA